MAQARYASRQPTSVSVSLVLKGLRPKFQAFFYGLLLIIGFMLAYCELSMWGQKMSRRGVAHAAAVIVLASEAPPDEPYQI